MIGDFAHILHQRHTVFVQPLRYIARRIAHGFELAAHCFHIGQDGGDGGANVFAHLSRFASELFRVVQNWLHLADGHGELFHRHFHGAHHIFNLVAHIHRQHRALRQALGLAVAREQFNVFAANRTIAAEAGAGIFGQQRHALAHDAQARTHIELRIQLNIVHIPDFETLQAHRSADLHTAGTW